MSFGEDPQTGAGNQHAFFGDLMLSWTAMLLVLWLGRSARVRQASKNSEFSLMCVLCHVEMTGAANDRKTLSKPPAAQQAKYGTHCLECWRQYKNIRERARACLPSHWPKGDRSEWIEDRIAWEILPNAWAVDDGEPRLQNVPVLCNYC